MSNTEKNSLLTQIQHKAEEEVAQILTQSTERLKRKSAELDDKKKQILEKISGETQRQIDLLERMMKSTIDMEKRRSHLKEQEMVIQEITKRVHAQMQALISDPKYPDILAGWICEGALALPGDKFVIKTSPEEVKLITPDLLAKAAKMVTELGAGRVVNFTINNKEYLLGQGVVLSLPDNKLLFSNTLTDRMARYDSQIRTYIFTVVFKNI